MAPTTAPHLVPSINKERFLASNAPEKKGKTFNYLLIAVIAVLLISGVWRLFAKVPEPKTIEVVAAAQDIPAGCRISFNSLHYVSIPVKYLSADMVTSYEALVGHYTRTYLPVREPILKSDLLPGRQALASQINSNERAITLKLSPESMVDYGIRPGDRVDVIATTTKDGKKFTRTIGQNLLVLFSVTKETLLSETLRQRDGNNITLSVPPEDAEKLAQATESSKLLLTLRNPSVHEKLALVGADDRDLLPYNALSKSEHPMPRPLPQIPPPPVDALVKLEQPPNPQPMQWVVDVFTGNQKKQYEFPIK